MIKMDNISKKFGNIEILENFSYNFHTKKMYAIVGPSGSGKTTLLNIIGLIDTPTSGNYDIFDYKNIKPNSNKAMHLRRNKISYLFQNYALLHNESIEANLKIALRYVKCSNKKQMMIDALNEVGLSFPLSKKIYELSGGEQQRVALARLLLKPSTLILADEPTGNLDIENAKIIINILKKMKEEGRTVIIVTHDNEVASLSDEIINLDN